MRTTLLFWPAMRASTDGPPGARHDKSDWRIDGQNVHDALAAADNATAQALDAADPDLNAFNGAGGKLIQYHGWNDAAIPAQSSINYY